MYSVDGIHIHTVMAKGAGIKKGIYIYNVNGHDTSVKYYKSFTSYMSTEGFKMLVGYYVHK